MNKVITLQELNEADLRFYKEIWLTSAQALADDHKEAQLCLWRSTEAPTHDMLSEGTHDQNLESVWLVVDDIHDQQQVLEIKNHVQQRVLHLRLEGEFSPAEVDDAQTSNE